MPSISELLQNANPDQLKQLLQMRDAIGNNAQYSSSIPTEATSDPSRAGDLQDVLGKQATQDFVDQQSVPGKTAADSAQVFQDQMPNEAGDLSDPAATAESKMADAAKSVVGDAAESSAADAAESGLGEAASGAAGDAALGGLSKALGPIGLLTALYGGNTAASELDERSGDPLKVGVSPEDALNNVNSSSLPPKDLSDLGVPKDDNYGVTSPSQNTQSQANPVAGAAKAPVNPGVAKIQSLLDQYKAIQQPQPTNTDYGAGLGADDLKAALGRQNLLQNLAALGKAGDTIGSAISRGAHKQDDSFYNDYAKTNATQPVQNILQQRQAADDATKHAMSMMALSDEKDKNDPNSPVSKMAQNVLLNTAKQSGMNVDPAMLQKMSASSIQGSSLWKALEINEQTKMRQIQAQNALDMRKMMFQNQLNNKEQSRYNSTVQQLEQTRGAPQVAQAEKDIYAAQKANSLVNMFGDPNKLNPQMVHLLDMEVGKIAQGGEPTMEVLKGLDPQTLNSKLAGVWQTFHNTPSPANAAAFVRQYQDYANAVAKDAQGLISDRYGRIINAKNSDLSPEHQKQLVNTYINRFNNQQSPTRSVEAVPGTASDKPPVKMMGPDGKYRMIPAEQVQDALAAGGKLAQ